MNGEVEWYNYVNIWSGKACRLYGRFIVMCLHIGVYVYVYVFNISVFVQG